MSDTPVFRFGKKKKSDTLWFASCSIFCVEWRRWIYPESLSHFRRMSCVTRWPSVRCTSVRWSRLPDNTPCPGKPTTPVELLYSSILYMAKCLFWYLFNSCPKISLFQCFPNVNVKLFWVFILGCIRHVLIEFWIYCIYREAQEEQAKERKRDLMRRAKAAAIQEVERIQGRCLEVYLLIHKVFCSWGCNF